jgi:hypothetical protein
MAKDKVVILRAVRSGTATYLISYDGPSLMPWPGHTYTVYARDEMGAYVQFKRAVEARGYEVGSYGEDNNY